jgi:hypothetical protein
VQQPGNPLCFRTPLGDNRGLFWLGDVDDQQIWRRYGRTWR